MQFSTIYYNINVFHKKSITENFRCRLNGPQQYTAYWAKIVFSGVGFRSDAHQTRPAPDLGVETETIEFPLVLLGRPCWG